MQTFKSMAIAAALRVALVAYGLGQMAGIGWGQTFTSQQPDCQIFFHFTATGQTAPTSPSAGLDNRTTACDTWNLSYTVSGFSAVSVVLQTAANNAGVPATYGTGFPVQQTVLAGSNPSTNTTGGFLWVVGFNAWVRVTLASKTGTGIVDGAAFGWRIPSASTSGASTTGSNVNLVQVDGTTTLTGGVAGSQGIGGLAAEGAVPSGNPVPQGQRDSSGNLIIPDYCTSVATFATSSSGNTQLVAVSGTKTIRVCHVDWSGATQTVAKLVVGTGSSCTSSADATGVFTGAGGGTFGFAMDYASPLVTTSTKTLCLNLGTGSVGGGTIIYSQR